jgi:hypothetical protein
MRYQAALRPDTVLIVSSCMRGSGACRRRCAIRLGMHLALHSHGKERVKQPCDEQDRDREDGADHESNAREEEPVAPVIAMRVLEVKGEQRVIATVRFPCDVEDVAKERHGADDDIEREVDQHARDGDVGCAARPCGQDDDAGGKAGEDVADARDEADDAVEPEADGGSGDAKPGVEHAAEQVEILVAEEAIARADRRAGRQDFGFALRGHGGVVWVPCLGLETRPAAAGAASLMLQSQSCD